MPANPSLSLILGVVTVVEAHQLGGRLQNLSDFTAGEIAPYPP
ncbi:MAG: hypothetical protein WBB29_01050 [Geitlerinemataceae cyanobacterium]